MQGTRIRGTERKSVYGTHASFLAKKRVSERVKAKDRQGRRGEASCVCVSFRLQNDSMNSKRGSRGLFRSLLLCSCFSCITRHSYSCTPAVAAVASLFRHEISASLPSSFFFFLSRLSPRLLQTHTHGRRAITAAAAAAEQSPDDDYGPSSRFAFQKSEGGRKREEEQEDET